LDSTGSPHPLYSGPGLLTVSNFQHVAVTYDKGSGIGTLYINGTVVARANLGSFTPQTSYPLYIGQSVEAGNLAMYSGLIDEISVYGRALSPLEIRVIFASGHSGKCPPVAPFIVNEPSSQTTVVGGNASFSVTAGGTAPLTYQWRLEGNPLTGATNSALNLSNVQVSDAGNYSVVVANPVGAVTSSNALLTVSTGNCVTASSGLVSWWPGEGNGNDVIGSNPGTVSSGVSYSAGEVGQAFNFDGTSGSIIVPASANLNVGTSSGFTVECWIKPNELSAHHTLVEWNSGSSIGVHLYISTDWFGNSGPGNLMANITDTSGNWHPLFSAPGLLTTNSFQHVALTYDKASGTAKLYLNGVVVASANLGSFAPQTSYDLYLGRRPNDASMPRYSGLMDEVSLYGRALSEAEIQGIYNAIGAGKCQSAAPFIVNQPVGQTVIAGANVSFSVTAGGTPPLSYQWRLEGNALGGATNSALNLDNVQATDAGNYSVVVSNASGTVTSSNALLTVNPAVCTNPPAGLVSWWPGEGNGNDVIGSNPGTVNSGISYSPGEVGQALNFNGTSGSIMVPASASLNVGAGSGFTAECWIKPNELNAHHTLVEWNSGSSIGVHLYISTDWFGNSGPGDLMANLIDTSGNWHPFYSGPGLLTTSSFQHVALTYDKASGAARLYLNGAVVASANLGSFTPQTSYNLHLGRRPNDASMPLYSGLLDEVSLYGRALSQSEIQGIYSAANAGKCQNVAPFIVNPPADQTVVAGGNASFSVTAGGSPPLTYQWRHNGGDISGATASALTLTGVQTGDAGNYAAVVANPLGSVTSAVAVLTVNAMPCATVPSGLVSWWAGEGNGNDVIGSNPAAVNSGVSYSPGEVGQAFQFDGTGGSIMIPASTSLNVGAGSGFTVESWIKPNELSAHHPLVEWNNGSSIGVHLYISTDWFGNSGPGDLLANLIDTGGNWHPIYSAPGLLTASSFQHVALTYDKASGAAKLYLNGAVVATANLGSFTPQTSYNLNLGRRPSDGSMPLYNGAMDEVSLYGRALSQTEIQSIYDAAGAGKCRPGPVAIPQESSINMLPIIATPAGYEINFGGVPNRTYAIQRATSLNGPWETIATVSTSTDGIGTHIDTNTPSATAFYRAVVDNGASRK
jgi:hypothetical protein